MSTYKSVDPRELDDYRTSGIHTTMAREDDISTDVPGTIYLVDGMISKCNGEAKIR